MLACATLTPVLAQHTTPDSWTPLIGAKQGWPQDIEGRAIHLIHVPPTDLQMGSRGKVLFFGVSNTFHGPVRPTIWTPPMAWDEDFGTFLDTANELSYEAFCCGHTLMEDGRVVITGSNFGSTILGNNFPGSQVAIYDPATNLWTEMAKPHELRRARYYPSVYRLADGHIATFGGQSVVQNKVGAPEFVDEPFEINPDKLTLFAPWEMPVESDWDFLNYPHVYQVSPTEMFFAGPSRHPEASLEGYETFRFDLTNPLGNQVPYGGFSELWEGGSVMYRPGKFLKAGGVEALAPGYMHEEVEATEHTQKLYLDLEQNNTWHYAAPMTRKRLDHNMVLLPDGRVFAVGGAQYHKFSLRKKEAYWVQDGEIWDPDANTWSLTAAFGGGIRPNVFRGYHSTAMLMPDARVLVAGGDTNGELTPQPPSGHFYLPDYGAGTRPEIVSAPDTIAIGSSGNQVVTDTEIGWYKVVLVGLGSVTHSLDSNQRWVELSMLVDGPTDDPVFHGPTSTTETPLGHYMLFVLKEEDGRWLPCKMAKYVKVVPAK
ncbi:MAG: galactose oxidase early set domain-containing protein [Fimbriimonadales bacterium]